MDGWDGMGLGWMGGVWWWMLFVVALSIRETAKRYIDTYPTWRDMDRYVPKRSIQVHAHRYVSIRGTLYRIRYVPATAVPVTESENVPLARP